MYKRIVIKLGTSVLTGGSRHLNRPRMVELVRQCAVLQRDGREVVIVTSGAVAVGRERMGFPQLPPTVANKQLFAAVGQSRLMLQWERFFEIYGIPVGQVLLTRADVEDRGRYLNARDSLAALLRQRIVPIINENDAIATEEIKVGDNDNLSALVTTLVDADLLLLLTDQPGLFSADPRKDPTAELIAEVRHIDTTLRSLAGGSTTGLGVGGMITKLEAADKARRTGADVVIAAGAAPDVIARAAAGESVGTRFPALENALEQRKRWILTGPKPAGALAIDAGAARALVHRGRSLLPVGLVSVIGNFARGDTVAIQHEGEELARGIVAYSSGQLRQLCGAHSDQIEERLGFTYGATVIHRDNMIVFAQ